MTAHTAIRLEHYFGNSAQFWTRLQMMHDLTKEIVGNRKIYEKIKAE